MDKKAEEKGCKTEILRGDELDEPRQYTFLAQRPELDREVRALWRLWTLQACR